MRERSSAVFASPQLGRSNESEYGRTSPVGAGPVELPEGLGAGSASPYTQAKGQYLGFGADFGAGDLVSFAGES